MSYLTGYTLDQKNLRVSGILITLLGAVLMSFDPIFIRYSGVSGFDTAFLFGLFTAISMPFFIQMRDERGVIGALRASGWPVLFSGLLMLGSASSLVLSIKLTSVANTFVILSISPALAAAFSWLFLGEVTKRATWISIISIMIGIAIVVSGSFGSGTLMGDVLAGLAVTCLSLNQTLLRKYQGVSRMASVGVGGFLLAVAMFFLAAPSTYSLNTWVIMGLMGLFTAPFGRVLSQVATRYITAPEVGMLLMIETVLAPLFAFGFFGEIPHQESFIGGTIIVVTILIYAVISGREEA
ncbi:EamA domain-containing membrane protein RarD [Pseudovibrio ascidiaceicola]|uniref:EamA domain-containing membrane protein RarD n=1 Tax=Pseudovibrio ascidiaceicola TaxID=285279 RepID=A0A1I4AJF4_9HYPH|nr:DMT family transporter [Pseudovibrio ascidiaceicola]SFK56632.1 EamA domain-containing membrane protein RarD [Pseudovibrio ascidiaceicola]